MPIFLPTLWQDKDTPLNFHQKHMKAIKAPVVSMDIRDANWDCVVPFFLNLSIKMQILFNRYWNICLVLREAKYTDETLLSTGSPGKEIWQLLEHEPIEAEQALSEHENSGRTGSCHVCTWPQRAAVCSSQVPQPPVLTNRFSCPLPQCRLLHPQVSCGSLPKMQGHPSPSAAELEEQHYLFGVENRQARGTAQTNHICDASALLSCQTFQRREHNGGYPAPVHSHILSCSRDWSRLYSRGVD